MFKSALEIAQVTQTSQASWATTWLNLGTSLRKLGKLDDAREAYVKVLEIDSRSAPALGFLGLIYHLMDRLDDAIVKYHEVRSAVLANITLPTSLSEVGRIDGHCCPFGYGSIVGPVDQSYQCARARAAQPRTRSERGRRPARATRWGGPKGGVGRPDAHASGARVTAQGDVDEREGGRGFVEGYVWGHARG